MSLMGPFSVSQPLFFFFDLTLRSPETAVNVVLSSVLAVFRMALVRPVLKSCVSLVETHLWSSGWHTGGLEGGRVGGWSWQGDSRCPKVFSWLYTYFSPLLLLLVHTKPSGTLDEGSVQLHVQHIGTSLVNSVKLCVC